MPAILPKRSSSLSRKKLRGALTLDALRQGIRDSGLSDYLKELALLRLRFAEEYIDDAYRLTDILRPGRLVIVDLRDEFIEKDEALGLFVVLLQMFADHLAGPPIQQARCPRRSPQVHRQSGSGGGVGRGRARDAPQGHEHHGGFAGPAVRTDLAHRAVHADHPAQVQLPGLAEAHPEGECGVRRADPCEARIPRPGRSVRMEQQGDG